MKVQRYTTRLATVPDYCSQFIHDTLESNSILLIKHLIKPGVLVSPVVNASMVPFRTIKLGMEVYNLNLKGWIFILHFCIL